MAILPEMIYTGITCSACDYKTTMTIEKTQPMTEKAVCLCGKCGFFTMHEDRWAEFEHAMQELLTADEYIKSLFV